MRRSSRKLIAAAATIIATLLLSVAATTVTPTSAQNRNGSKGEAKSAGTSTTGQQSNKGKSRTSHQLLRIKFHKDLKAISYTFQQDKQQRIITYRVEGDKSYTVDVRETPTGTPFITVRVTPSGMTARTSQGVYKLVKGQKVVPAKTDAFSVWLIEQNLLLRSTTRPKFIYDKAMKEVVKLANFKENSTATPQSMWPILSWPWIWERIIIWGRGEAGCTTTEDTCTASDEEGRETEQGIKCDCGIAVCTSHDEVIQVPALIMDRSTGDVHTEEVNVTITTCTCVCEEISLDDTPYGRP